MNVLILFPMVLTIIDLAGSVNRHVFVLTATRRQRKNFEEKAAA